MTAVVLTDVSTAITSSTLSNDWVAHEFTNTSTLYLTAQQISSALFAMNYEFMLGAKDKPLNAGLR